MKTATAPATLPSHNPSVQTGTTPSPDELALNRAVKEEAVGRVAVADGDKNLERTNQDIINDLKTRHIVVERERVGQNGEAEVFRAIWNNGNQPLEQHTLVSQSFREALLEAESIEVSPTPLPPNTEGPKFSGFRGGLGKDREQVKARLKDGSSVAKAAQEHAKDPQRPQGTLDQAQRDAASRPVPTGNPHANPHAPAPSPAPTPVLRTPGPGGEHTTTQTSEHNPAHSAQ